MAFFMFYKEGKMKNLSVRNIVLAGFFLAVGIVLPFFTMQIPSIGNMLLPMHIPVLICGFVCGWPLGLIVGFILPLLRSMLFTMPPMYPTALAMAFELAAYGAAIWICNLYSWSFYQCNSWNHITADRDSNINYGIRKCAFN